MENLTPQAERKLAHDLIVWLTTTRRDGTPVSRPVWFAWSDPDLLVYSQPRGHKVAHLARDPRASVHFNSSPTGEDIVVFDVLTSIEERAQPPSSCPEYLEKYGRLIPPLGLTVREYDSMFSTLLRLSVLCQVDTEDSLTGDG